MKDCELKQTRGVSWEAIQLWAWRGAWHAGRRSVYSPVFQTLNCPSLGLLGLNLLAQQQ